MKNYLCLLAFTLLFAACSDDNVKTTAKKSRMTGEELVYDASLQCYVPKDFNSESYVLVLDDEQEKSIIAGRNRSLIAGGGIASTSSHVEKRGGSSAASVQRAYSCPQGAVVTGLGLLFLTSNATVQDMLVQYQFINENGTLDPVRYRRYAPNSRPTPDYQLEAWISLPPGAMATGVGLIGKYDVQRMELWFRYYNSSTRRYYDGEDVRVAGIVQTKPVQILFKLTDDIKLKDKSAFTGMGFGIDNGGVGVMAFEIGYFLP
jgi:hypothetical protein